jgi:transcriptional regulator with XRE-family HTH domain
MKQVSALSDEQIAVGAALAHAREDAGMTTSQVSDATRVRRGIIEAIERGDMSSIPGGEVYARGHIRAIAVVLGIDAGPLLAQLDAQPAAAEPVPHEVVQPVAQPTAVADHHASLGGSLASTLGAGATRRGPNWSGVMIAALALVIAVAAIQLYRGSTSGEHPVAVPLTSPTASTSSPPTTAPTGPATSPPPTNPSTSPPGDVVAQGDAVTVALTVTGKACWMRVTTATQTLFEGTLTRGTTKTFQDKSKVKLLLGNAGGVSLVVNGVDVGHPGGGGQVATVTFGPGNPTLGQA